MNVLWNGHQVEIIFLLHNFSYTIHMHLIKSILSITVTTALLMGEPSIYATSPPIIKNIPVSEQAWKFHNEFLFKNLKDLLEQGDWGQLYEKAKPFIDQHELRTASETLAGDKLDKQLLIDWYVVLAPLFELNADIPLHESHFMEKDIRLKEGVMNDLYVISKINLEQNRPSTLKKETAKLCSIYAATVVGTLRNHYRADIDKENRDVQKEKERTWQKTFTDKWSEFIKEREQYEKNWRQPEGEEEIKKSKEMKEKEDSYMKDVQAKLDKQRKLANKLNVMRSRNSSIEWYFKRREGTLINILLLNYPDKSPEVFNYLKMAGYEEKEMMPLVDRTIGRSKKTEFLYQSNLGRKFLKEKEKKAHYKQ